MIRYVTYVVSFRVRTLPWNSYRTYVMVYFAISECITHISKLLINKCVLWPLNLFDNLLLILETG